MASALERAAEKLQQPVTSGSVVKKDGSEASREADRLLAAARDLDDGGRVADMLARAWTLGP
eukprot:scaffold124809_cov43-Prasinocladus_malaysianus.AAC.1